MIDPCNITYFFYQKPAQPEAYQEVLDHYQSMVFGCTNASIVYSITDDLENYIVRINIADMTLKSVFKTIEEGYELSI